MVYELSFGWTVVLLLGIIWELAWKGVALWRAAQRDEPVWFACLLVIASLGVLPIIYLLMNHEYHGGVVTHKGAT